LLPDSIYDENCSNYGQGVAKKFPDGAEKNFLNINSRILRAKISVKILKVF
jgi:hypothetical protein